ncbi:MAG TPA: bifunctional proline dehydrogenase/L-glutamate gamma-semialdehyde dehydrogenase PutA [Stellaceae bacterium]|jgi:RHH-type proline utilization regulon transcriptional repressor/proline dehydrogenase/delta 1-pyrroline-5-carboxylate dehydrogenase|nr:bifunctional proline dehydrogenase/L-glutamate gamma-semialdehyde dehydrogenase PutA [Stellaceae bacterium]
MDWVFASPPPAPDALRQAVRDAYRPDESDAVARILAGAERGEAAAARVATIAGRLVLAARRQRHGKGGIDAFLNEFALSSREGIALMCLAEALLRIPDADTVDRLIRDKLAGADWARHLGHSSSLFVNASTWALMLTGRLLHDDPAEQELGAVLRRLVARTGEPVLRQAVTAAMRILGHQFVMGRTIDEALARGAPDEARGYRYSFDMLGEAARTAADAARYAERYRQAIAAIGVRVAGRDLTRAPGISVKLSALDPRYEEAQRDRVLRELPPLLLALARQAMAAGIGFTIDAEEADRLDLSLDLIAGLAAAPELAGWNGLGLALQAYQKRALPLIDWLAALARKTRRRLMLRLVKGAYWDSEIKRTQERGLDAFPVYTRKLATDVSYLACAQRIWAARDAFFPQFATHNAHTVASILDLIGDERDFEFQRLHGMGEALYDQIVGMAPTQFPCRVYAPVGGHEDLLAYLVRRLLENGANTSFVNRLVDERAPVAALVADPVARLKALGSKPHPRIKLPRDLYPDRRNSRGIDLGDPTRLAELSHALAAATSPSWSSAPIIAGQEEPGAARAVSDPADRRRTAGWVTEASDAQIERALAIAAKAAPGWDRTPAAERARSLDRAGDLLEEREPEFIAMIVREGGRIIPDALAEVREAIDHCRYDATRLRGEFAAPAELPGPTGERNLLELHGRGVFACISPWNFPLAIFLGQIAGALAAGNAVIAKPAEQTPLVAAAAVRLLQEAGIPPEVMQLLPGEGPVGAKLVADPRIAGIAFTGSTDTARAINLSLAQRPGPIVPFIAETGGQNALIADSSALPEQFVADALVSAFDSAGQRCSSVRVLFVQDDIADRVIAMLTGAMDLLTIGDPARLATDIGPLIDEPARAALVLHDARMRREAKLLRVLDLPPGTEHGTFFAPRAFELDRLDRLTGEVFGPILHVIRWQSGHLDRVLDAVIATGFGLTLGIHSRIDETARAIHERLPIGNTYINRNTIGAVVGVQPFGGERLSGTGPKIGGPHYLHRFATERTLSIDTTAAGGNASLMSLKDDEEA